MRGSPPAVPRDRLPRGVRLESVRDIEPGGFRHSEEDDGVGPSPLGNASLDSVEALEVVVG